ncbi:MAG: alanine racemase domain protein [Thermomicrobiales bacterium]|nr:alanine racemase domain protein [Thermomicrobiales bacterium]MDF3017185.1 alanine racemase domain protein [Thermomicrobiales bacterium]
MIVGHAHGDGVIGEPKTNSLSPQHPITRSPSSDLAARVDRVVSLVAEAARSSGRQPEDVTIVAVTKTVDRDAIEAAYALGLRHFGENRVQDAGRKLAELLPDGTELHLIGQLQSNKAKPAVALFDIIESVDRISLIDALEKEAERRGEPVSVLLQVNIAREPQKGGCLPESAPDLMERLVRSPWLRPRGLMTIAPLVADAEETRPVFSALRALRDALQRQQPTVDLDTLSMGMSDDFRVAIVEGATSVRIGRAIFEEGDPSGGDFG